MKLAQLHSRTLVCGLVRIEGSAQGFFIQRNSLCMTFCLQALEVHILLESIFLALLAAYAYSAYNWAMLSTKSESEY